MGESSASVSLDVERISFGGKEHHVLTSHGPISVAVYGDLEKPGLITYPDVALNYMSCFQGLFFCPEAASLLLHNFCIYHISPPGHELGAAPISPNDPVLSVDQLADQVADVLDFFDKGVRGSSQVPESDIVQACRSLLDQRHGVNVWRFLQSINERYDLAEASKKLQCRTLIFVGENSPFRLEAINMVTKLDRRFSALVEVQACGSVVTEEQPYAMLIPIEYFLMGYGLYRPSQVSCSPRSPLSPSCISPELLSPESMGVKLKPIKTRISLHV